MTDKPIIFSAPMVRALIEGRKTQTRRVLKPQPVPCLSWSPPPPGTYPSAKGWSRIPYAPGDRLWVKEAVTWVSAWGWRYRADNDDLSEKREQGEVGRWRSPIHMPRWASRLTLTVTDVRVQRLRDISEADAVAEGVERLVGSKGPNHFSRQICGKWSGSFNAPTAQEVYANLWNSIHGPDAWERNPWVAAYTFTVQRGNIDDVIASEGAKLLPPPDRGAA